MARAITNVRYGPLGSILFDYKGKTIRIAEPLDVLLVGVNPESAADWIVREYSYMLAQL